MGLRIGQFVTTCHVPRALRHKAGLVDELAHGRFARDLGDHLGPSLSRQPAIVRIRRLSLRVIVPAPELNEDSLSRAWAAAFSKALFTALAYPSGTGPVEVFRADSLALYLAGAIRDLLHGVATTRWYYDEFNEIFRQGGTEAALTLLCRWNNETIAILSELARAGELDRLLARFDDLAMERIFRALGSPHDADPPSLSIAELIAAAKMAAAIPPEKAAHLRSRRYALRRFVDLRATADPQRSVRTLHHLFTTLWILIGEGLLPPGIEPQSVAFGMRPPAVQHLMETITQEFQERPHSSRLAELNRLIDDLRIRLNVPPPTPAVPEIRSVASDWCGLFFLAGTLDNLGWIPAWRRLGDFQRGGISSLIAGLALTIAGKLSPELRSLDPGIAFFAGYVEEPDLMHLRSVLNDSSREARREVLQAALGELKSLDAHETWEATFNLLADALIQRFASNLRGFRQATRSGIVRTFLQRPGRIRIEDTRIVVAPEPSPYHVVLHIAGMDSPTGSLSWLGGRRLEFEMGDL